MIPREGESVSDVKRELQRFRNELAEVGIEVTIENLAKVLFSLPEGQAGGCISCGRPCPVQLCWNCFLRRIKGEPDPYQN